MPMHITRVQRFDDLAPHSDVWNQLAAENPFRRWEWNEGWWRHYGQTNARGPKPELYLLAVWSEQNQLIAVLPCQLQPRLAQGRALELLGGGEVCGEYRGLLTRPEAADEVARALAAWLTEAQQREADRWDVLRLRAVHPHDVATLALADRLGDVGNTVARSEQFKSWRVDLPATWDEFLMVLSKQHRNRLRRWQRTYLDTGLAKSHRVHTAEELAAAWPIFVDLHQRRRRSLGQPGCFASPRFAAFHRELAERFLQAGLLRLSWMDYQGQPIAAEYHFGLGEVVYAYQAGISPEAAELHPGELITIAAMQNGLSMGYRAFDYLRGDEPYKAYWRCQPLSMLELNIVPSATAARLRSLVYAAGASLKSWLKTGLAAAGWRQE